MVHRHSPGEHQISGDAQPPSQRCKAVSRNKVGNPEEGGIIKREGGEVSGPTCREEANSTERANKIKVEHMSNQKIPDGLTDYSFGAVLGVEAYLELTRKCRQSIQTTLGNVLAVKEYEILFTFFF